MHGSKWKIVGMILSGIGALTSILATLVSDKQMEEEIRDAVKEHFNSLEQEDP